MKKIFDWVVNVFAPKMQKIASNPWIAGLQDSITRVLPFILVGSLVTVYNVLRNYITSLPDLSGISTFTFGLISLFMAFLIPYSIMERKKHTNVKYVAGLAGISLFMIIVNPQTVDGGSLLQWNYFGAGGMFVAIVSGLFSSIIMNLFSNFSLFKEDSVIPTFVRQWFDTIIPIFIIVFVGWLVVIKLNFNLFDAIVAIMQPVVNFAQTLPGVLLLYLVPTIFYSVGVSGWVFKPILDPIAYAATAANVAAGAAASNIFCNEVIYSFISLGGRGVTLSLVILMLIICRSKKLKVFGKVSIGPSLLNINEPIIFGTIVWNPLLMIPMILNSIVAVVITYVALTLNLVAIPAQVFSMWYCPVFISGFICSGIPGVILTLVVLVVSAAIWYPFLKAYDAQCLLEEEPNK